MWLRPSHETRENAAPALEDWVASFEDGALSLFDPDALDMLAPRLGACGTVAEGVGGSCTI